MIEKVKEVKNNGKEVKNLVVLYLIIFLEKLQNASQYKKTKLMRSYQWVNSYFS